MADAKVLEAQKWVNSTYGNVAGYVNAPEDGKTGWATMYSLTRALQHELGISTLSNSFGPGTIKALATHGDIDTNESNKNIVKIIQSACYCKGYDPGGITGTFSMYTQGAVSKLANDAGLDDQLKVTPKVFKALLTMDAYVKVAGGRDAVRNVQQWLNGKYLKRSDYFIIPCDGFFSRDVQKALIFAIQYELGMADGQANGIFGPGTQSGLKQHTLEQGVSGAFVQIFRAAMIFNNATDVFNDTFDDQLLRRVKDFQGFCELPVTGKGDYQTWTQLLVSTGDPERPGTAADCVKPVTEARAQALKAAGYTVVGRYLDERPSKNPLNKQIQPGELDIIFKNGLRVFPISQYYGGEVSYFTYPQGFTDALGAHAAAVKYGFDQGTVIYFAVDYDATDADIESNIIPYFNGIVGGLASKGKRYIHGVYGSRNVCAKVTKFANARYSFVSGMSTGFSGNMGFPLPDNWSFNQIAEISVGSGDGFLPMDKDVHRSFQDSGVASVNNPGSPTDGFVRAVEVLYGLSQKYAKEGYSDSVHVLECLRHPKYTDTRWTALIGEPDFGFINYANKSSLTIPIQFKDPNTGVDMSVDHFGASANGVVLHGQASGNSVNMADFAGWGGDLITFYGEWRRDSDRWSSGYTYCKDRLAKIGVDSTFPLDDLLEDVDAYNVGMAVRGGTNVVDAIRSTYSGGGHLSRFKRFYEGRFGGSVGKTADLAREMLTGGGAVISAARTALIYETAGTSVMLPSMLPGDKLDEFCKGFADVIQVHVGQENARLMRLRARAKA
ncbi:glycoside hydrolase domain-containing protein [Streptomyces sp. NPDC052396]|uniref:glycoside hydrolase domain-containing protein n=1 Tax=Streptomyces sp. NPDC052396 TaxID=3365689 RepID=UPI0037D75ADD